MINALIKSIDRAFTQIPAPERHSFSGVDFCPNIWTLYKTYLKGRKEMNEKSEKTRKMTTLAVLAATAFVLMAVGRIQIVSIPSLKYDPKDIVFILTGFIFGPISAFLVILVVCLIEMFTVSDTWFIGFIMNLISSCTFVCTAAYIYKKTKTIKGAVIGLVSGCLLMTAIMLLWNYIMVPIYMPYVTREAVKAMLLPTFLPFNLLKGGINLSVAIFIYKPIVNALRKAQMIPPSVNKADKKEGSIAIIIMACFIFITCIFTALVMNGII